MTVNTFSAVHITPVVIQTFFRHWKKKAKRLKDGRGPEEPQDDIFFDQAFHIVKAFLDFGAKNTIESLQAFTNTHVPAPPWAAVCPVLIPLKTCNAAADHLIDWFGSEELAHVVGGERWWQVRGMDGIDAEWVAQEEDLGSKDDFETKKSRKLKESEANILRMEKLESVMMYVHGGGYSFGSINTHRYQILHYTHKFSGRAFAVNYRKVPQYPWPCPLQDVLAAYLYLIQPPPEALHKPVSPSKVVFAGDSAGGGLCLTVLTVLRDLGLPMPAGATLISPWVDLTHSFPSVMANYHTDIIPKHGFLAKPSTLWPNPTVPESGGRIVPSVTNDPPLPGHADVLKPSQKRLEHAPKAEGEVYGSGEMVKSQQAMLDMHDVSSDDGNGDINPKARSISSGDVSPVSSTIQNSDALGDLEIEQWEPKPPKILMENPNAIPLELRSQIQMYASTELLTHPLVSPIVQASFGNLPPLYIIAGDGEDLRDEVMYLAHKAACPANYPARPGVLRDGRRQKENAQKFTQPTNVHLQVFDGMCHVLTVFLFSEAAKCAYRSIGEFIKHVTFKDSEYLERHPFPEFSLPLEKMEKQSEMKTVRRLYNEERSTSPDSDVEVHLKNSGIIMKEARVNNKANNPIDLSTQSSSVKTTNGTPEQSDSSKKSWKEQHIPVACFIRERVDIHGKIRPMELPEEIPALKLKPSQIGIIKEAPALRWLDGQKTWDKRYHQAGLKALKKRAKYEAKAAKLLKKAFDRGFVHHDKNVNSKMATDVDYDGDNSHTGDHGEPTKLKKSTVVREIQPDRRWGPLDLYNERPPATAIAGRWDTTEGYALLKKSIYHTAPVTHKTIPKLKVIDVVAATLNPNDDPHRPPRQSVSEQQVRAHIIPVHALNVWDGLFGYFGEKTSKKIANGVKTAAENVRLKNGADGNTK